MACKGCLCSGSYSGCGTDSKCHAYYGRISASGILYCMGHCLSAVFSIWISIAEQESAGKPQIHYTDRNGRSFCICAVIPENPFCDRKLFHMTGTGLGAILFGPCAVSVLGIIVLIFQAVLLAHGGLTTLGANCFSMAIAGPILSWLIYKGLSKTRINRRITVFLAASLGDLFTYCVTSVQLALAYPSAQGGVTASAVKFLGIFAPTQLPLAVIEGILTVVVVIALESFAKSELKAIDFEIEEEKE